MGVMVSPPLCAATESPADNKVLRDAIDREQPRRRQAEHPCDRPADADLRPVCHVRHKPSASERATSTDASLPLSGTPASTGTRPSRPSTRSGRVSRRGESSPVTAARSAGSTTARWRRRASATARPTVPLTSTTRPSSPGPEPTYLASIPTAPASSPP